MVHGAGGQVGWSIMWEGVRSGVQVVYGQSVHDLGVRSEGIWWFMDGGGRVDCGIGARLWSALPHCVNGRLSCCNKLKTRQFGP